MDPSLSWQYFGSSAGFLRRYPGKQNFKEIAKNFFSEDQTVMETFFFSAIKWPPVDGMPEKSSFYDFRTSSWYIDAATSSKDVVILIDSSSSMSSSQRDIARAIANSILDTLGNNDFVNIFRFSETTEEIVPCFKDLLVQVRRVFAKFIKSFNELILFIYFS